MFLESPHRESARGRMERDSDDVIAPSPYRRSMRHIWRGIELKRLRLPTTRMAALIALSSETGSEVRSPRLTDRNLPVSPSPSSDCAASAEWASAFGKP